LYAGTPARREQIVRAALEVFGTRGYRGTLRETAERVGLTQAGIIHHFGSKKGLMAEVLRFREMKLAESLSGLPLRAQLESIVDQSESEPEIIRMFTTLSSEATVPDHPAHEHFAMRYQDLVVQWTAAIEAGQRDGEIGRGVNANVTARLIIAALDGLNIQWLLGSSSDLRGPVEYLLDALLPGADAPSGDGTHSRAGGRPQCPPSDTP